MGSLTVRSSALLVSVLLAAACSGDEGSPPSESPAASQAAMAVADAPLCHEGDATPEAERLTCATVPNRCPRCAEPINMEEGYRSLPACLEEIAS